MYIGVDFSIPSKTLSHGELCGEKSESGETGLFKKVMNGSENRREGLCTHGGLPSGCVEVEYAAFVFPRENDLRAAQRHGFCLWQLARTSADACWRPGRDSIVASGKVG